MTRKWLTRWIIFFACFLGTNVYAQVITQQGYRIDSCEDVSLSQLENWSFIPYEGVLNRGYGKDCVWIKLRVAPEDASLGADRKINWIIRIRPAFLSEIALFDTNHPIEKDTNWHPQLLTGVRHSSIENGYDSINHGFLISNSDHSRDIYLRLKTATTRMIGIEIFREDRVHIVDREQLILNSMYISILAIFLLVAAIQWMIIRDRLLGLFFLKQATVFVFGLTYLGYFKLFFGENGHWEFQDFIVQFNNFAYIGILYFFELYFLSYFIEDKRYCKYAFLLLGGCCIGLFLFLMGFKSIGLSINMHFALLGPLIFVFLAFKTKKHSSADRAEIRPVLSRQLLISFYLIYVLFSYLIVLPSIGLIQAREITLSGAIYISIVSTGLMSTLLVLRALRLNRQKIEAENQVNLTQQKLIQEQAQREQQSRFISMLVHELKNPISVAQISLDAVTLEAVERDRIKRALKNMNDIIERCRISDELEGNRFHITYEQFNLREVLFECIDLLPKHERVKVIEGNDIYVRSDLQLVSVMIANLLDNALKYSPDSSTVTVQVLEHAMNGSSGAVLIVSNEIGSVDIPDAEKMFQKYYRSKAAESKSGSGLGLYLTAGIAQLLHGFVTHCVFDHRIEFELWLPD